MPSDLFNQNTGSSQGIATYSPNWAVVQGGFDIPTGNLSQFRSNTAGDNLARWTGPLPSGDHEAIVTFTTNWNSSGDYAGISIGLSNVAANGYALIASKNDYFVGKFTAGSEVDIGSGSWTLAVGDRIKLSKTVSGSTVTLKVWRALAASPTSFSQVGSDVVDNSGAYTAGTYGIYGHDNSSAGNYGGPWDGNDLGVVPATLGSRRGRGLIHPGRHPDRFGKRIRTRRYNTAPALSAITGTAAVIGGSDSASAAGAPVVSGTAAARAQSDNASASGQGVITGTAAVVSGADASAASGAASAGTPSRIARRTLHPAIRGPYNPIRFRKTINTASPALATITGSAAVISGADRAAASGSPVASGTAAVTSNSDSIAATGAPTITGTAAAQSASDKATASGSPVVSGTAGVKGANDQTIASQNAAPITGTAAVVSGTDLGAASGAPIISGTASVVAKNDSAASVFSLLITGFGTVFSASDSASASGTLKVTGTGSPISQGDGSAAAGTLQITGTGAARGGNDITFFPPQLGSFFANYEEMED